MPGRSTAERILAHLHTAAERTLVAETAAADNGLLQHLDARAKLIGLAALILTGVWTRNAAALFVLLMAAAALALASRLHPRHFAATAGALSFTLIIALPSLFLTPGDPILRVFLLGPVSFQGCRSAMMLLLRVTLATSCSTLLILTTPWSHVMKSLRILRVPVVAIVILSMTYRYVFVLLRLASDLFEARESRCVGRLTRPEERRLIASGVGVLLSRALVMSEEVYLAMRSRGFLGEVYVLNDLHMRRNDWFFLS